VRGAAPSTMLRMVPLPRGFATGEDSRLLARGFGWRGGRNGRGSGC
jgi:hypothetical protein